jgi:hypothetical protein
MAYQPLPTKNEDDAHASGDAGIMPLAVRHDTPSALAGTNGDYIPLTTDNTGALRTTANIRSSGGNTVEQDINTDTQATTVFAIRAAGMSFLYNGSQWARMRGDVNNGLDVDVTRVGGDVNTVPSVGNLVSGTASSTGTGDTEVIAAQGAGVKIYVTHIIVHNASSTDTFVTLKNGSTALYVIPAPAKGGASITLPFPLATSANAALNFASNSGVTTMYVSASGFKGA